MEYSVYMSDCIVNDKTWCKNISTYYEQLVCMQQDTLYTFFFVNTVVVCTQEKNGGDINVLNV